jgi:hypothetical protein
MRMEQLGANERSRSGVGHDYGLHYYFQALHLNTPYMRAVVGILLGGKAGRSLLCGI